MTLGDCRMDQYVVVEPPVVELIDVGHGNAALVGTSAGFALIDCAPSPEVLAVLRSYGVTRLREVVITHWDRDHFGGLSRLVGRGVGITIDRVWFVMDGSNRSAGYLEWWAIWRKLRRAREGAEMEWGVVEPGRSVDLGDGMSLRFLLPHVDAQAQTHRATRNGNSVVCRLEQGGKGLVLFLGDVTLEGFRERDGEEQWACEWVVASHHGGYVGGPRSSAGTLVREVHSIAQNSMLLVSHGRNRYCNPLPEVVHEGIGLNGPASVVCTGLSKRCHALGVAGVLTPDASSCAGTVSLRIHDGEIYWEGREAHGYARDLVESPLCLGRKGLDNCPSRGGSGSGGGNTGEPVQE